VFYLLNSLVIFVVAMGSNTVGLAANAPRQSTAAVAAAQSDAPRRTLGDLFVSSAMAQSRGWCCAGGKVSSAAPDACVAAKGQFFSTQPAATKFCAPPHTGFFRPWVSTGQ
jgi:hypothetical protein